VPPASAGRRLHCRRHVDEKVAFPEECGAIEQSAEDS